MNLPGKAMCKRECVEKRAEVRRQQLEHMKRRKGWSSYKVLARTVRAAFEGRFLKKTDEEAVHVVLATRYRKDGEEVEVIDYVVADHCPFCGDKLR